MEASVGTASAETYPSKPITMICPYPAGGPLDALGRILGASPQRSLGQPVIVENVTGANASIGTGRVARAAPDGYTLGLGYWGSPRRQRSNLSADL
jgi:tripartite-type tricarboxylate transporter receptor subunit TctC